MPIYEYQCGKCGHHLEIIQKMSDVPLTTCPKCHQSSLNKLISASGFQLKGSGWYATDYSKTTTDTSPSKDKSSTDSGSSSS